MCALASKPLRSPLSKWRVAVVAFSPNDETLSSGTSYLFITDEATPEVVVVVVVTTAPLGTTVKPAGTSLVRITFDDDILVRPSFGESTIMNLSIGVIKSAVATPFVTVSGPSSVGFPDGSTAYA